MTNSMKCSCCGRAWHELLIDAKRPPNTDENSDFTILEGPCCYGNGWLPLIVSPNDEYGLTKDMLDEAYAAHKKRIRAA